MNQGIYRIRHLETNAAYIGQTRDFIKRWRNHRTRLRANQHHSKKLQGAWNSYGESSFIFEVLERIDAQCLDAIEQEYINAEPLLLNQSLKARAGMPKGFTHSEATRQKISAIHKGRKYSAEIRAARSARMRGKPRHLSEEGRARLSIALRGNRYNGKSDRTHCVDGHLLPTELRMDGRRKNCRLCDNRRTYETQETGRVTIPLSKIFKLTVHKGVNYFGNHRRSGNGFRALQIRRERKAPRPVRPDRRATSKARCGHRS